MIEQILQIAAVLFMFSGMIYAAYWKGRNKGFSKATEIYQKYINKENIVLEEIIGEIKNVKIPTGKKQIMYREDTT